MSVNPVPTLLIHCSYDPPLGTLQGDGHPLTQNLEMLWPHPWAHSKSAMGFIHPRLSGYYSRILSHIPLSTLMLNVQTSKQPRFLSFLDSARVGGMTQNSPGSESVYRLSTPNPWHPLKWSPSLGFPRFWWCEDTLRAPCPSFPILKLCKGLELLYPSTCL